MDDRDEGGSAQGDALIPVSGEPEALGIDHDASTVAAERSDDGERFIFRAIVGNDEVEGFVFLLENAFQGFGKVPRAVHCRDGDGESDGL